MSDTCTDIRERIVESMVTGQEELSPDLERHLGECRQCARFVEAMREDDERLSRFAEAANASIARVEESVQQALRKEAVAPQSRREGIMFKRVMWVAAAAVLVVSAVGYLTGRFGATTPAWADVQKTIARAVSVTYVETYEMEGSPPFEVRQSANEDGCLRSVHEDGSVTIMDFSHGVTLNLWPQNETALVRKRVGRSESKGLFNYVNWIKTLHKESGTFLRKERVDGVQTNVFEVERGPFESHTIWVDAATGLPVRVETTLEPADTNVVVPMLVLNLGDYGGDANVVRSMSISNTGGIVRATRVTKASFNWNAELNDSLFSVEAPRSYRVEERQMDVSSNGANDLAMALRNWVNLSGGTLPDAIEDLSSQDKVERLLMANYDRDGKPEDELEQALAAAHQLLKGLMFAELMRLQGDWGYRGKAATVGDPNSVICWWQPEDSDQYLAVYGDFRVDEVTREMLNEQR